MSGAFGLFTRREAAADTDLAALLEALEEPAALCDLAGFVVQANGAWRDAAGQGGGVGNGAARPLEGLYAAFRAARQAGRGLGALRLGDTVLPVSVAAVGERRYLVRMRPLTERVPAARADAGPDAPAGEADETAAQREQRLAQRNKMEAIGQLAGGVAHDFNNLLSAIGLRAEELLTRHPLGDPAYENLSQIRETVNRAAALVRQLLTFSRKATVRREVLDVCEAMMDLEVLLRRLLRENMRLETDFGRDPPLVRADKAQLETAVMNLVVNARDALRGAGREGGGVIRLRVDRIDEAEALALGYPGPLTGDLALIEVADDGPGLPPEVIDNVFEPFFTTKPAGEGTGLGLATVYGIVRQAEGWVVAASPPEGGAAFRIFLPIHAPRAVIEPPAPVAPRRAARDLSGAGRILFVEDETRVRDIAARLLRARGYEVIEAEDGEQALALAEANAGAIDLMISDVIMPGMDGPDLLRAARPHLGEIPVLFISGYAEAEFSDLLEGERNVTFLPKPLDIQSLAEQVKARLREG